MVALSAITIQVIRILELTCHQFFFRQAYITHETSLPILLFLFICLSAPEYQCKKKPVRPYTLSDGTDRMFMTKNTDQVAVGIAVTGYPRADPDVRC